MPVRHSQSLPRLWLMTDERMGDRLEAAIRALPRGSGIVFRHYQLGGEERQKLLRRVETITRRFRHLLLVGGKTHGTCRGAVSAPVHSVAERVAAERRGARLLFVSPVFATNSHPGARALGRARFGLLIRGAKRPVIALGGMNAKRARSLSGFKIHGWAGIDALTPKR